MDQKLLGIKVPTNDTIKSRTSTVAKSLATSIIPRINPTEEELEQVKKFFSNRDGTLQCAYCSGIATEWDHFHPLVRDSKPTGYITDIYNLVPCCSKCNGSKGNKDWRDWLEKDSTNRSPKGRGISPATIDQNMKRLNDYEVWGNDRITIINFDDIPGFKEYWKNYEKICKLLEEAQNQANDFKFRMNIYKATNYNGLIFSVNGRKVGNQWQVVEKYVKGLLKEGKSVSDIDNIIRGLTKTNKMYFSEDNTLFGYNKGKPRCKPLVYKKHTYYLQEDWYLSKNFATFVQSINEQYQGQNNPFKVDLY